MSWITTRRYAWPILVALAIFAGLNAAASPAFTDSGNWNGMLIGAAPFIITAMAQTAVVMSGDGGVDLSVGPLAGLVNALIASVLVPHGWTDPVSIVGAIRHQVGVQLRYWLGPERTVPLSWQRASAGCPVIFSVTLLNSIGLSRPSGYT